MQNCTHSFREMNLVLQHIQESQIKSKTVMIWSSQKKKRAYFVLFTLSKRIFSTFFVLSQCMLYWIHFQNIHTFTYQKALLYTLFCRFLKSSKAFSVSLRARSLAILILRNSLRKKIEFLEPVIRNYFDISLVSETKLDSSFWGSQFSILGYRLLGKDRVRHGRGLILYVNQGIPSKTINTFNFPNSLEVSPLEINLRKPPSFNDEYFLDQLHNALSFYSTTCDNFLF